ncbi:MAG: hypothetical protein H8D23_02540 [Candidatus Brocadiales bacterium]|nr:hypothetical protein [Candidatus Brocadiales bacterium]
MKDVKQEIFGSRHSSLKSIFLENNIKFSSEIWIISCRFSINSDKKTRYIVCIEGNKDLLEYKLLLEKININIIVLNVLVNEDEKTIFVKNIRDEKTASVTYESFMKRIVNVTKCKYIESFASGSRNSTPFSRFFRENMGKGFALTDIDFYILRNQLFIEEKNYIENNKGFLGVGQCISFKEAINDVFIKVEFIIVCNDMNNFFISNLNKINCRNTQNTKKWGKMVGFDLTPINIKTFVGCLKDDTCNSVFFNK